MNSQTRPRVQIFLLNGPPYSGKDTLADYILKHDRTFGKLSAAFPIKEAMKSFFCLSDAQLVQIEGDRSLKDAKSPLFLGKSWREVLIKFSEEHIKPTYGEDVFGKMLVNRIRSVIPRDKDCNIIISDCGFTKEVEPLVKAFGKDNVHVIKIERKKSSFENDSREYIDCDKLGIKEYFLRNNLKQDVFCEQGRRLCLAIKSGTNPHTTPFGTNPEKSEEKKSTKTKTSTTKK